MPMEGIALAAQALQRTKQTSEVHVVALKTERLRSPQKLSAKKGGSPAILQLSSRFQNFVSQFFSQTFVRSNSVSQAAL